MSQEKIQLDLQLISAVLQYLGSKTYSEVYQLISAIQEQAGPQVAAAQTDQPTVE